ncbi:hypothetical protein EZV62_003582 [Acer yangbiense]|uniref:ABC transporter domain-containing protein n=1 Tax=Acer yangbiense TaxID=1000413 RepID=A0A5C7IH57_9ROSI|nr:hypothetical protein EZV62_003582 [Acer yangbiense]
MCSNTRREFQGTKISLEVKRGQKIVVCGQVGASKSTFLCAILGEVYKIPGSVSVTGTIVYVAQAPWIKSGTIRDDILFGKPMEKTKYEMVTKSCTLDKDINSAVDAETAAILFNDCVMAALKDKTVILATCRGHGRWTDNTIRNLCGAADYSREKYI